MTGPAPDSTPARAGASGGTAPTFWRVARRPKWIAVLLLVLVIAGIFAWLGRWQLERSFDASRANGPDTEAAVEIREVATPQAMVDGRGIGRKVATTLEIVPGDTVVIGERLSDGVPGWWVVAHALDDEGASLAVAVGWAATRVEALDAVDAVDASGELGSVTGRYLLSESPQQSDFEAGERSALAVAELVNLWSTPPGAEGTYGGYLVLDEPLAGLERIHSPAPPTDVEVNLLNLFYAAEWVVFAGAAFYLWWRLVKDEQERESEPDPAP